jgi:hypothetical protein
VGLTQETHFEEGSREFLVHQAVADWKSIRSDNINVLKATMTHAQSFARSMLCVSHGPTAKDQNDEYRNQN